MCIVSNHLEKVLRVLKNDEGSAISEKMIVNNCITINHLLMGRVFNALVLFSQV